MERAPNPPRTDQIHAVFHVHLPDPRYPPPMPLAPATATALRHAGVPFDEDVPLARRTYWRVGGPADALARAGDAATLARLLQVSAEHGTPVFPLGNGSNLLVSDQGVRGIVVTLVGELAEAHADGDVLVAGGGARIAVLLTRAARHRWAGLELLAGIPGTIGGAVRMNAGTALGEIADRLIDVDVALPDGTVTTLPKDALGLGYRRSALPAGGVVARARLRVGGDWAESEARMRHHLERRKATQPLDLPSCGSTFQNPPGDAAGRLIEACGLKGYTVGGAQVSPKHANFVVNLGGATASDIDAVIRHAQAEVLRQFGVALQREVQYAGVWPDLASQAR